MKLFSAILISTILSISIAANAGSLSNYKKQKHQNRPRVTEANCPVEFVKQCVAQCKQPGACSEACNMTAHQYCEARKAKREAEQKKLLEKAGTLFSGF